MEDITIKVDDAVAKDWQNVPNEIKRQLEASFGNQIAILTKSMKVAEFKRLRSELSSEAQKNGLTEEILEKLLNEE